MHATLEKQKYKKFLLFHRMSWSSFKLLINWAIIMIHPWGWRGRNNLQVGEMRHEWLPSLTCAMPLVCVRSRQIPSVLSPFSSVISGWEHQLPPPFLFFCRGLVFLSPFCCFIVSTRSPCGPSFGGSRLRSWDILNPKCQPLGGTQPKLHSMGERESKKKLQVFLAQPHILPCLSPPDFTCSWIMMCHPLHISHGDSGSIRAALSSAWGIPDLTLKWQLISKENTASLCCPLSPVCILVSEVSRLLYRKQCESSGICRINEHRDENLWEGQGKILLRQRRVTQFHLQFGWGSCLNVVLKHSCEAHEDATLVAHQATFISSWEGNKNSNSEQQF